jgi:hypothetical protein
MHEFGRLCAVDGVSPKSYTLADAEQGSSPTEPTNPIKQLGTARNPYTGHKKAIVIALDVGTTFSGVSYAILDPGEAPKIYEVTRCVLRVPSPPHFHFTPTDALRPSHLRLLPLSGRNTWADVTVQYRFPGQEHQAGNPKIPTVIWYDRNGDTVKAGAEAEEQSTITTAKEQGWTKVELYVPRPVSISDKPLLMSPMC